MVKALRTSTSSISSLGSGFLKESYPIEIQDSEAISPKQLQSDRNTTEPQHRFPPSNRWTNRTNEPMGRKLPSTICLRTTEQLERSVTNGRVCTQLLETRAYQTHATRTNHWYEPSCSALNPRRSGSCCTGTKV